MITNISHKQYLYIFVLATIYIYIQVYAKLWVSLDRYKAMRLSHVHSGILRNVIKLTNNNFARSAND
jgi:hypothetical protein